MAGNLELQLRIQAGVSGQAGIDDLIRDIARLGGNSSQAAQRGEELRRIIDRYGADSAEARAATQRLNEELRRQREELLRNQDGFAGLRRSLSGIGTALASLVGFDAIRRAITGVLQTGAEFEVFRKRLDTAFGGVEQGSAAFARLQAFAKSTPLALSEVVEAATKLKSFGLDPLDGALQALVDTNARVGGSAETLNRIILAAGQSFAKGRLQGEELLQFAEAGVPVFDALSKITGKTTAEVIKLAEGGRLGRDVIKHLLDELGRQNAGAAAEQMQTLTGVISNAKDEYEQFQNTIAQAGPLALAKEKIKELGQSLAGAGDAAKAIGTGIVVAANVVLAAVNGIKAQFLSLRLVLTAFAAAGADVFAGIAKGLSLLSFGGLKQRLEEASAVLLQRSRELQKNLVKDAEAIARTYGDAKINIGDAVGAAVEGAAAAKDAANATQAANEAALAASRAAESALREQQQAQEDVRKAADAVGLSYDALIGKVDAAEQAVIDGFVALTQQADLSAEQLFRAFDGALAKLKTSEGLRAFETAVRDNFLAGGEAIDQYQQRLARLTEVLAAAEREQRAVTDASAQAAKALGLDFERITTGISTSARTAISQFAEVARANQSNARLFFDSFKAAAAATATSQELVLLREALKNSVTSGVQATVEYAVALGQLEARIAQTRATEAAASQARVQELTGEREAIAAVIAAANARYQQEVAAAQAHSQQQQVRSAEVAQATAEAEASFDALGAAGQGFTALIIGARDAVANLSAGTKAAVDQLFGPTGILGPSSVGQSVAAYIRQVAISTNEVKVAFDTATESATRALAVLEAQGDAASHNTIEYARSQSTLNLITQELRGRLINAVAAADARAQQLRDTLRGALSDLQDELDSIEGREKAIADRRRDRQREQLQEQLKDAERTGNADAIQAAQAALRKLDEVIRAESARSERQAAEQRAREAEQAAQQQARNAERPLPPASTTPPQAPVPSPEGPDGLVRQRPLTPSRTVRLELVLGPSSFDLFGEAEVVNAVIKELERQRRISIIPRSG